MEYLQTMPFYYKLLAVSVCVLVVAVILYFVPGGRIRIPAIVFCGFACLLVGIAVGVIGMSYFGFHWEREPQPPSKRTMGGGMGGGAGMGGEAPKKGGEGAGKKGEGKKGGDADAKNGSEKKSKVDDF